MTYEEAADEFFYYAREVLGVDVTDVSESAPSDEIAQAVCERMPRLGNDGPLQTRAREMVRAALDVPADEFRPDRRLVDLLHGPMREESFQRVQDELGVATFRTHRAGVSLYVFAIAGLFGWIIHRALTDGQFSFWWCIPIGLGLLILAGWGQRFFPQVPDPSLRVRDLVHLLLIFEHERVAGKPEWSHAQIEEVVRAWFELKLER